MLQKKLGRHSPKLDDFLPQQPRKIPYRRALRRNGPPFGQRVEGRCPLVVKGPHG